MIHLRVCCQICKYWGISQISFCCLFLNSLIGEDPLYFFNPLIYAEIVLWHNIWSILENILCVLENNAYFVVVEQSVLKLSVRSTWLIVFFKSLYPDLFCLVGMIHC